MGIIPSRSVHIYSINLTKFEKGTLLTDNNNCSQQQQQYPNSLDNPSNTATFFELDVECGGGTYMRSLARDIAMKLGSVATVTSIIRVKQGPFMMEDALERDRWCVEEFINSIDKCKELYDL